MFSVFKEKQLFKSGIFLFLTWFSPFILAMDVPIYDFSITAYTQNSDDYLPQDSEDYSTSLLEPAYQAAQMKQFYQHYYASDPKGLSPWSEAMVKTVLPIVATTEWAILDDFNNQNKDSSHRHYAENFKEHDFAWWRNIQKNMELNALQTEAFREENKAIAVTNTFARALPEQAPDFFHFSIAGQGFPFDNLQESVVWSGTPLYVISISRDKGWSLVLTPDAYFAWVKSSDIAYVSSDFINRWQAAAEKGLVAITATGASVVNRREIFQFTGYMGAVFPFIGSNETTLSLLIPIKNQHQQAVIAIGRVNKKAASVMPLVASKENIVKLINQLKNRPYGWGGAFFFNDCSQELKSLFTPFGIWLPRNSASQSQLSSTEDLSKKNMEERLSALKEKGHPLMTLIYIGGHVMLYVGNREVNNQGTQAITYQNIWGISPLSRDKRYVIGQSLFFPLLKSYPENPDANSPANSRYFKLVYLDALDTRAVTPEASIHYFNKGLSAAIL